MSMYVQSRERPLYVFSSHLIGFPELNTVKLSRIIGVGTCFKQPGVLFM